MPRILALFLVALAPFAHALPAERPISDARRGIAAETGWRSMQGTAGEDRFLVTWESLGRGTQAAVLDLAGNRLHDTSIGLPVRARVVFWHAGGWTIIGRTADAWAVARVDRDGVVDPVVRPFALDRDHGFREAVWTGSSLVLVAQTATTIEVAVYDADLHPRSASSLTTLSNAWLLPLATDGETVLIAYNRNGFPRPPLSTILIGADGSVRKTRDISHPGEVRAIGSAGNGSGYLVIEQTGAENSARFGGFRLDHNLSKRSIPGFGRPNWLFATSGSLSWDGSAFAFFYLIDGGVRMVRFSEAGSILEDEEVTPTDSGTMRVDTGLASVGGMGTTVLLFMRGEGRDFNSEPQFLRAIAGHDAAGLRAAEEVELELGAFEQIRPAAASNATQSLVAWRERGTVLAPHWVYATRVDAEGNVRDPQSLLLGGKSCDDTTPSVATNGDSFLVTWYDDAGVMAARIGADGSVANTRIQHFREAPCEEVLATALSNGTDYLVVWRRTGNPRDAVLAARVAADGSLLDTVPIDLGTAESAVFGASNGSDYLLAWDGRMIRVAANGTRLDARINPSAGTRVAGTGTTLVWWNGSAYSLVQYEPQGFGYGYQLAHVTSDGAVAKAGTPVAWPAYVNIWGGGSFTCHGSRCTSMAGTVEGGEYFLRPILVVDDGVHPFLRIGDAVPVAPVLVRDPNENMHIVPFGVPGGRQLIALTRYSLDDPYDGISRIFLRPVAVVRGRTVRH